MNLVDLQVYRVEKVGKYSLSPSKKSIFNFFKLCEENLNRKKSRKESYFGQV
jgi:hypothetical protein